MRDYEKEILERLSSQERLLEASQTHARASERVPQNNSIKNETTTDVPAEQRRLLIDEENKCEEEL